MFNIEINEKLCVYQYFVVLLLCLIFFLFPFQIYIIGNGTGIGIEGAVYRYQISVYGNSLITILSDIKYILQGVYSGKTALSIILWVSGTVLLTATTIFGLLFVNDNRPDFYRQITYGLVGTCFCYLISSIAQYGFFFNGPAGTSLPFGVILILFWIIFFNTVPEIFSKT